MIEGIEFINEDKRSVHHFFKPVILQLQIQCACRSHLQERNANIIDHNIKHILALIGLGERKILSTHLFQKL